MSGNAADGLSSASDANDTHHNSPVISDKTICSSESDVNQGIPATDVNNGGPHNSVLNGCSMIETTQPHKSGTQFSGNSAEMNDVEIQSHGVTNNNLYDATSISKPEDSEDVANSQSIEAISLVDIKASIANDPELIKYDKENGNVDSLPDKITEPTNGLQGILDNQTSHISSSNNQDLVALRSGTDTTNNDVQKQSEPESRSQKVISNYAILPGELTDQLIEGPSITLPSSELSNRNSVVNKDSNSNSLPTEGKQNGSNRDSQSILGNESSPSASSSECATSSSETFHILSKTSQSAVESIALSNVSLASSTERSTPSESDAKTSLETIQAQAVSAVSSVSCTSGSSTPANVLPTSLTQNSAPGGSNTPVAAPLTSSSESSSLTPAPAKRVKKTPHDFIFGKVLGEGSYSTVYLAKEVSSQKEFAVKVCEKKHLIREQKTHFVMREKEVLMKLDHPFFIRLAYTFQDPERLYYVLTYARNGELLSYLNKLSVFDVPCTKFYSAEIVVALEYLQTLGIVHRDLKPENILLGDDMHIKITDFGTSKILNGSAEDEIRKKQSRRKNSFVGTAEYVTPEVLNGQPANFGTDLWALACIIYQCLSSSLPFRCGNEYQTFQRILKLEYEFPEGFNPEAKDLIQNILVIEPTERLGMKQPGGMEALKQHPFFQGMDWDGLPTSTPPKLLPYLPANADNPEFWGGQDQRTGFDDQRVAEIITGQSVDRCQSPELEPVSVVGKHDMEENEWKEKIEKQRKENQFHQFVENNLILRQGFVDKRKGLFARKRMLLLTEGPHLYYVDAHNKVLKGEIPWSKELRSEAKNFKIFFVHTPNRTYYLESRQPDAHLWVKHIQEVWGKYYDNGKS